MNCKSVGLMSVWAALTIVSLAANCYAVPPISQTLYWGELIPGGAQGGNAAAIELNRANINGANVQTIATTEAIGSGPIPALLLEPIAQKLYWTSRGFIKRANLDGSNIETVVTSTISGQPTDVRGLGIDHINSTMYWVDNVLQTISRADLNGANQVDLLNGVAADDLALDQAHAQLYFKSFSGDGSVEGPDEAIERINVDGTGRQTVVSGIIHGVGIAIDPIAEKLYWSETGFNTVTGDSAIRRCNLDGSGVETILANLSDIIADIEVEPSRNAIFWTSLDEGAIKRSELNGSNVQTILTGLSQPHAILVIPEPTTAVLILNGLGMQLVRRSRKKKGSELFRK